MTGPSHDHPPVHTYGRRRGRRLRGAQQALLRDLLPRVRIELPEAGPFDPRAAFGGGARDIWLEIGFGGGEHLAAQAADHPDIGLIGCEPFVNGVVSLLAHVRARGLANVRVWPGDARALMARLPDGCLARAFVLFPDPWPKARHHKRRLVAPPFLDEMARLLRPGGELRLATDDRDYAVWMLAHLTAHPALRWLARRPADWRARPPDWPETRYERKALAAGRRPVYLRFRRRGAGEG